MDLQDTCFDNGCLFPVLSMNFVSGGRFLFDLWGVARAFIKLLWESGIVKAIFFRVCGAGIAFYLDRRLSSFLSPNVFGAKKVTKERRLRQSRMLSGPRAEGVARLNFMGIQFSPAARAVR